MTPADTRHLERMLEYISAIRARAVSLVQGADSLLFLRDALEDHEAFGQVWFDEYTSHLVTLESAGVDSAGQVLDRFSPHETYVTGVLDALEGMVRSRFPDGLPPGEEADADLRT